ncbi:uncharacterized protein B0J16DRAFT_45752 [Fusarium flagelliforme]|uniref:uncharacterized protein n=1 Tax=Fusarium flagelliforme TaxID=2675880 RepID=UPI001E8CC106|nr:uncharacterized protein B0J16DRAFT_45752 [Fusarium flagelliforme]KAH7198829.1 hypothetical protein B0J16DRAFT_45752 [Fusarium flagelliforme]
MKGSIVGYAAHMLLRPSSLVWRSTSASFAGIGVYSGGLAALSSNIRETTRRETRDKSPFRDTRHHGNIPEASIQHSHLEFVLSALYTFDVNLHSAIYMYIQPHEPCSLNYLLGVRGVETANPETEKRRKMVKEILKRLDCEVFRAVRFDRLKVCSALWHWLSGFIVLLYYEMPLTSKWQRRTFSTIHCTVDTAAKTRRNDARSLCPHGHT